MWCVCWLTPVWKGVKGVSASPSLLILSSQLSLLLPRFCRSPRGFILYLETNYSQSDVRKKTLSWRKGYRFQMTDDNFCLTPPFSGSHSQYIIQPVCACVRRACMGVCVEVGEGNRKQNSQILLLLIVLTLLLSQIKYNRIFTWGSLSGLLEMQCNV